MPTYSAQIQLQNALATDYLLLNRELQQRDFNLSRRRPSNTNGQNTPESITVTRQSSFLQDITTDILQAAHKTGKKVSFTVIKNKS